jgi:very-short-patch-repair endonuclease
MRSLYFTAAESGMTRAQLRHGESRGAWRRVMRSTYRFGSDPVTVLDECLALVVATSGTASGAVAGVILGLDSVALRRPEVTAPPGSTNRHRRVRRRRLLGETVDIGGIPCASALQTLIDLAAEMDDETWEQALESALRRQLVTIADITATLPSLGRARTPGTTRIRRVLRRRPEGAPPTGSLLETLFVQLVRRHVEVADPARQVEVRDMHDEFVAFVDFAWIELGLFIELDGQHHEGQPVHDARRETAVIATTGWFVGRFTWDEILRHPVATARRLEQLLAQARRRALPAA